MDIFLCFTSVQCLSEAHPLTACRNERSARPRRVLTRPTCRIRREVLAGLSRIFVHAFDAVVARGGTVTLPCRARGEGVRYHWLFDGEALPEGRGKYTVRRRASHL